MPKYTVVHPKLHLAVQGKKQHCPQGSVVTMDEKEAEKLGKLKVIPASEAKRIKSDSAEK